MTETFFDQLEIGMAQELGSHTFSEEEIIEFANQFDPQPFHLDHEAAAKSHFGALSASGWHTLSIWMKMNLENGRDDIIKQIGWTGKSPQFGPSPGVRNVKWLLPVYVGDTISYRNTSTGKRRTSGRPGWGMVMNLCEGFNQHGKLVVSMNGAVTLRTD